MERKIGDYLTLLISQEILDQHLKTVILSETGYDHFVLKSYRNNVPGNINIKRSTLFGQFVKYHGVEMDWILLKV